MKRPATRALAAAGTAAALLLTACGKSEEAKPGPAAAADQLATGLGKGDVSAVPLTGEQSKTAAEDLKNVYAGMGTFRPKVEVKDLKESGDEARGTLHQTWTFGEGDDWTYDTPLLMRREGDAWKTVWEPKILAPDLEAGQVLKLRTEAAERGEILGAGDEPLVTSRSVWDIGIDKSRASTPATLDHSARALAKAFDLDEAAFAKLVKDAGPKQYVRFLLLRTEELTDAQQKTIEATAGAVMMPDDRQLAPTRTFAAPFLGKVAEASAEDIEKSKGTLKTGDMVGKGGLEGIFQDELAGTPGRSVSVVTTVTGASEKVHEKDPKPGSSVRTTLDVKTQTAAEKALEGVKTPSAAVVIKPSTGEVLAVANGEGTQGYDTALLAKVAPGSTFKMASSLALLRTGLTPTSKVSCPASTTVSGRTFNNFADYPKDRTGEITLTQAVANSCNTAFIGNAGKLPQAKVIEAAQALGLGETDDTKTFWFVGSLPTDADGTEHAAGLIGQGKDLASPLGVATMMASVVKGATVNPVLLPHEDTGTKLAPAKPLTAAEAAQLRTMLRAVVTEGGGKALKDVPGGQVIAKTGTAEYTDSAGKIKHHTWMAAGQGDLAVAVFVEDGEFGSTTCGPVMAKLLTALAKS